MNKAAYRQQMLQQRMSLSDRERSRFDDLILIQFQQWHWPDELQTVLSYWPIAGKAEPNTFLLTDFMEFRIPMLRMAYPVARPDGAALDAILVNDDTNYRKNQWGIAEPVEGELLNPQEIDLVLVPLLAFDKQGHRLGYGKGFYDRFLTRCNPNCVRLGISYFGPIDSIPERNHHDIPLTACITPDCIYEF